MVYLIFTSSPCLAFLSFSHGRTWLRAGDRAPRGSRKTETARPFRSARSLRAGRTHPGNRQDDRTRQDRSALPKCRPSANVRNAATITWPSLLIRPPKIRALATIADLSPVRAVAPGCMAGFLWPSTARRPLEPRIFPCRFPPQAGTPTSIPRACACSAKIRGSGRGAALRLPSARLWRLRLCFVFPAMNGSPSQRGTAPQDGER